MNRSHTLPILQALLAAALFGSSAPLSKLLLGEVDPIPLAALLYLGSGGGLLVIKFLQRIGNSKVKTEAPLKNSDLPWLAGAILTGGIVAPILLLLSLRDTPAATAALLLNFEGVATTLIAAFAFKESVNRRVGWAVAAVTLGCVLLSFNFNATWGVSLGALGVMAACALWGADNNLTRQISAKDPIMIVMIKGLGAGVFSLGLTAFTGSRLPGWQATLGALALGSLSYGLSIVLFIRAMRGLGAARTSTLFSAAPLAGLVLSLLIFQEPVSWLLLIALPLMIAGAVLLMGEDHNHSHTHVIVVHEHAHSHADGHHGHAHNEEDDANSHAHEHDHPEVRHQHDHLPDTHHRHVHP